MLAAPPRAPPEAQCETQHGRREAQPPFAHRLPVPPLSPEPTPRQRVRPGRALDSAQCVLFRARAARLHRGAARRAPRRCPVSLHEGGVCTTRCRTRDPRCGNISRHRSHTALREGDAQPSAAASAPKGVNADYLTEAWLTRSVPGGRAPRRLVTACGRDQDRSVSSRWCPASCSTEGFHPKRRKNSRAISTAFSRGSATSWSRGRATAWVMLSELARYGLENGTRCGWPTTRARPWRPLSRTSIVIFSPPAGLSARRAASSKTSVR